MMFFQIASGQATLYDYVGHLQFPQTVLVLFCQRLKDALIIIML